jgi:hypothetical protein
MATATTTRRARDLSDQQLEELMGLLKGADSVELKLTVPESDQRSAVLALGMDPLEAQIRQVFFFDTPDLSLNKSGVVVRARRVQNRGDDSVVKLRPVVPSELPDSVKESSNLVIEVDAMPGGYVCSASLKGVPKLNVRGVVGGQGAIRKLFSKEQRNFYSSHAPEGIDLDDLSVLGPITLLKLKMLPKEFPRKLVAELWVYPDGSRILELSTKCAPRDAFNTALESRVFLEKQGIDLSGEQQTKTKTALDYFSKVLRGRKEASKATKSS